MRRWQLELLEAELIPLHASELIDGLTLTLAPLLDRYERMRLLRLLERLAGFEDEESEPIEVVEYDPEKAAEWLRQQGWLTEPVQSA